jgi:cysteine desulfurase
MIYLDNASTTQPLPFEDEGKNAFGNPSSPHGLGIAAERAMNVARGMLSALLRCEPAEITFTSGGTESNNMAILGYALALKKDNRKTLAIVAEPWAHPSVLEPACHAESLGLAAFHALPVEKWANVIGRQGHVLACLSHVNHETGDVVDIASVAEAVKKANPGAVVLVDGAQGFCKEEMPPPAVMDMYSFAGHKFHASVGTGGLAVRGGIGLAPLLFGGGQERGQRPGTENLPGILHMAHAARFLHDNIRENHRHVSLLKESLASLAGEIQDAAVNGLYAGGRPFYTEPSPYILNMSFPGAKGEILVHMLSEKGIHASMGAACRSRKRDKSALSLMGFPREAVASAVRFGFSHLNTMEEIVVVKNELAACVKRLRKVSGWK